MNLSLDELYKTAQSWMVFQLLLGKTGHKTEKNQDIIDLIKSLLEPKANRPSGPYDFVRTCSGLPVNSRRSKTCTLPSDAGKWLESHMLSNPRTRFSHNGLACSQIEFCTLSGLLGLHDLVPRTVYVIINSLWQKGISWPGLETIKELSW